MSENQKKVKEEKTEENHRSIIPPSGIVPKKAQPLVCVFIFLYYLNEFLDFLYDKFIEPYFHAEQKASEKLKMEAKKDAHYFLELLNKEKSRILKLADDTEKELENLHVDETDAISVEDTSGLIRSVIGKARLLATDKFKQFQGLCEESIKLKNEGPNKIQSDDLQGFWDMMMIQVESVDAAFNELEEYRKNGWKKPTENNENRQAKRPLSNKTKNSVNIPSKKSVIETNPELEKKQRERRKKLLEMKLKFKSSAEKYSSTEGNENSAFII